MPSYKDIEKRSAEIYELNRGLYLKERTLYSALAELMITPLEEADSEWKPNGQWSDDTKTAIILVIARMFNDFETSQNAILRGLAEQSYMPMRDAIECMMLTRLFRLDASKADDWLYRLKHYQANQVKKWLEEAGEPPVEYLFFDFFSKRSHANLIGSGYRVVETSGDTGSLESRTFHFGADPNHLISATAYGFLLVVMFLGVHVVLRRLYMTFLSDPESWSERVVALGEDLKTLDVRFWQMSTDTESLTEDTLDGLERDLIDRKSGQKRLTDKLKFILDPGDPNAEV